VINAILAVVLTFSFTLSFRERIGAIFSKKIFGPALTAAIIFGIGYVFALSAVKGGADDLSSTDIKSAVNAYYRQSLYGINPEDLKDAPYWGNKDAKVTIVEFSDFQCPFCRIAAFNIKPYLYEFKDKVKFVFVNYPLDNSCNKYMQGPMHQSACIAAEAVTCAGEKGKFWELHDLIFRNQKDLSLDKMIELGEKAGLDKDWLTACMGSGNAKAKVLNDIELAHKIYLTGTPSVFINNRILRLWRSPEVLRAIIKEEIKKNY
jgi:protein-disulfide isomerase